VGEILKVAVPIYRHFQRGSLQLPSNRRIEAYLAITKMDIKLDWQLEQPIIERGTVSTLTARKEQLTIAPDLV
jgi:hypothetical protein